jgi:phosphohistidine phosphatase
MVGMRLRLIVMRHAKAGELPGGPDSERALRERGRRDAAAAGGWLRDSGFVPEAVLCSPARRTRQTWQYLAPELGHNDELPDHPDHPDAVFSTDPALYQADADDLLAIAAATPEAVASLLLIGHHPAAADLAASLTGTPVPFPTAAIAVIALPGPWAALAPGTGELTAAWTPR